MSIATPSAESTGPMGCANVCPSPPAKSRATGFAAASFVTISEPESPPALNASGPIEI